MGLIKIIDVENELSLWGGENPKVGQVGISTKLDLKAT
jgi:hypothetical protein